jgi:putative heme-binding domain-containing protein
MIKDFLVREWRKAGPSGKKVYADLNGKHRMGIAMFGGEEEVVVADNAKVDLNKIRSKKGMIGSHSIEDVMLALDDIKGNVALGKEIFKKQGCVACHSLSKGEVPKGPYMGQIGSIMTRHQIAESILKPNASISQGFASVQITTKDKKDYLGFVTQESADQLVMRNTSGEVFTVKTANILTRKELETSMMPTGLANSLSYDEFASLVTFFSQQKK